MSYHDLVMMRCFDERKCFAKTTAPDGNYYCTRLVGEPYQPGKCPFCKENAENRGGESCRK